MRLGLKLFLVFYVGLLASCGGGGGDSKESSAVASVTPPISSQSNISSRATSSVLPLSSTSSASSLSYSRNSLSSAAVSSSKASTGSISSSASSFLVPINTNLLQTYRLQNGLVTYYIDSQQGDDQNTGTSPDLAWKSLDRLGKIKLKPGDSVRLSRGSVFTNQHLYLDSDDWGTEEYPIIIEAYGQGELPTIEDPRALWDKTKLVDAISVKGRYIHIFDIRIKNAEKVWGVSLDHSSHHIIIGGMDIDSASGGIRAHGENQKILSNYIRNIGSKGGNSGGICIVFVGKSLEFAWNRMVRCVNDTMTRPDGSAFEYYGYISGDDQPGYEYISEDIHIHHNFLEDGLIFMEAYGAVKNMTIAYNVYLNGGHAGILFHFDHSEPLDSLNHLLTYEVKIINNTFLPTQPQSPGGWGVIGMLMDLKDSSRNTDPMLSSIVLENNIVVTNHAIVRNVMGSNFSHKNNIYWLMGAAKFDLLNTTGLNVSEKTVNPEFVSFSMLEDRVNIQGLDLRLKDSSPAVNAAAFFGYDLDVIQVMVPKGKMPDIGAYESY